MAKIRSPEIVYMPPQAIELEEVVLGALLLENKSINHIIDILKPEIFYKEAHQKICTAILNLESRNEPFDVLMVMTELKRMKCLDECGGPVYLTELMNRIGQATNIEFHIRIVVQKYVQRRVIELCNNYTYKAHDEAQDPFDMLESFQSELAYLGIEKLNANVAVSKISERTINDIIHKSTGEVKAVYFTGHDQLDKILAISPRNVLMVGALRGHGKTLFIVDLVSRLLERHEDIAVLWYPMEDSAPKIIRSMISRRVFLSDQQMNSKNYKVTQEQIDEMIAMRDVIDHYDLEFNDEKQWIKNIKSNFRKFCSSRRDKFNILIIDNIMLLKDNHGQQTQADDYIARTLNDIMTETGGLVIAVHHFTKDLQDRQMIDEAYRPGDKHLKGSGRYPDAATQVLLINRPGKHPDLMKLYSEYGEIMKYLFIVDINKNRDGNEGLLHFFGNLDYKIFQEIYPINYQQKIRPF